MGSQYGRDVLHRDLVPLLNVLNRDKERGQLRESKVKEPEMDSKPIRSCLPNCPILPLGCLCFESTYFRAGLATKGTCQQGPCQIIHTNHSGPEFQPQCEIFRLGVFLDDGPRVGQAVVPHRTRIHREERLAQANAGRATPAAIIALYPRSAGRLERNARRVEEGSKSLSKSVI